MLFLNKIGMVLILLPENFENNVFIFFFLYNIQFLFVMALK